MRLRMGGNEITQSPWPFSPDPKTGIRPTRFLAQNSFDSQDPGSREETGPQERQCKGGRCQQGLGAGVAPAVGGDRKKHCHRSALGRAEMPRGGLWL